MEHFEAILQGAVAQAPPRHAAGWGDHVVIAALTDGVALDVYCGIVVDVLPCGTFVCSLLDPRTGREHMAPIYSTDKLRRCGPR